MKRMIQGLLVVSTLVLLQAVPAQATIERIFGGDACLPNVGCGPGVEYPVRQGQTTTITVKGYLVDLSTALEVTGSGVSVSSAPGTTSSNKNIRIVVGPNAAVGLRTIKLRYLVETSGPDTFKIRVVRAGRVTDIDVPSPTQFFNDVKITLTGENIGNAEVSSANFNPAPSSVELIEAESSETRAVVRLRYTNDLAAASGSIRLRDKSCGSPCTGTLSSLFNYTGLNDPGLTNFAIIGPNAVKEIRFPITGRCGNACFKVGDVFTAEVVLLRPAKTGFISRTGPGLTVGGASLGGEVITWLLVPPGNFAQASPQTPYNPNGSFNNIRIPAGNESIRLDVQVGSCPGSGLTNSVTMETWTGGNTNSRQSPQFKQKSFTIDCQP